MATVIEPRRLEDLWQDAIARVHAHYTQRRTWLRLHEQEAA